MNRNKDSAKSLIFNELKKYRAGLILLLVLQVVTIITSTMYPRLSGSFIDSLTTLDFSLMKNTIIAFIIVTIAFIVSNYYKTVIRCRYKERVSANLNEQLVLHLQKIPLLSLLKKDPVKLSHRISMDSSLCIAVVTDFFTAIVYSGFVIIIGIVSIGVVCWYLIIPLVFFAAVFLFFYNRFSNKIEQASLRFLETQNRFFSHQTEQLEKAKTIKCNRAGGFFYNRTQQSIEELVNDCNNEIKTSSRYSMIVDGTSKFTTLILWAIAFITVLNGTISISDFVMISAFYELVISETKDLNEAIIYLLRTRPSYERIKELLSIETESAGTERLPEVNQISTKDLSFKYDDILILNNKNILLKKGTLYLVKGNNGKGKSTLLNLLAGIFSGFEGQIFYDNTELSAINLNDTIGIVEQEPLIINGTIRENLLLGINEDVDEEKILSLLSVFHLETFIDKLDEIPEGISGGEKQKIAIIRAMLRSPSIFFFDEATSALDPLSVSTLKNILCDLKRDHIIFIVQHGNELDDIADEIIEL